MEFRWNAWNIEHLASHGVAPEEVEAVVRAAARPYPLHRADGKWLVWGRGRGGRLLQVIYLVDDDGTVFVVHARPLNDAEKRRFRRGGKP
jgi:uncharacterized DUF497 family protein